MKRLFLVISLVIIAAAVVGSVDFIVQRSLDRYLPPLLTRELGLPVTLAPIRADTLTLTARTDRLQMGPDSDPAVVATNVSVSLNWRDLLSGEIRLITATGDDLRLKISSWPSSEDPLPTDYHFLDPWLPRSIDLEQMHYIFEDGGTWTIEQGQWRRSADGSADLAWHEQRPAGSFDMEVALASLVDFLGLKEFDSTVTLSVAGESLPDSNFKLQIAPATEAAYALTLAGSVAGMQIESSGSGKQAWAWPTESSSHIKSLYPARVAELVKLFVADGVEDDLEQELQRPLPTLALPFHRGTLKIDEIRVDDEMVHDNEIEFLADGPLLAVTDIKLKGPSGKLRGAAAVVSNNSGWEVAVGADIATRQEDVSLLDRYLEADWFLSAGMIRMKSSGSAWGELLDGMTGLAELEGSHHGAQTTPIKFNAQLGGSPQEFSLENIALQLGDSVVNGEVHFSGGAERKLHIRAEGNDLDLRFLFGEEDTDPHPGVPVPEYLALFPGIDVAWDVDIKGMKLPSFELAEVTYDLSRGSREGHLKLTGTGMQRGKVQLQLDYKTPDSGPTPVTMAIDLERVDLPRVFGQGGSSLDTRTSGRVSFSSSGNDVKEVFEALQGRADLDVEVRDDNDWARAAKAVESLKISGLSNLIIRGDHILGVEIDKIDIASTEQDISGNISIAVDRPKFLIATLDSSHFNLARVLDWLPEVKEASKDKDMLAVLRELNTARLDISISELLWFEEALTDFELRLESGPDRFDVSRLDFRYPGAQVRSKAELTWQGDTATLAASGQLTSVGIEQFVEHDRLPESGASPDNMEGDFKLQGSGKTLEDVVAGLSGHIELAGKPRPAGQKTPPPELDIDLQRVEHGMSANVNKLVLAGSDLKGIVYFAEKPRRQVDIKLDGGVLDLEPWELQSRQDKEDKKEKPDARERATRFIGEFLSAPARIFGDDGEVTEPGDRIFSAEPLDLESLQSWDLSVKGKLDKLNSTLGEARGLDIDLQLDHGVLEGRADASYLNGGNGLANLHFDSTATPPTLKGELLLRDTHGNREQSTYPRSAHAKFDSSGSSVAELAGNLNGMGFLEAGKGPIDYGRLTFITTDVATRMFRTLIPGAKDRQPELQCAIALFQSTEGKVITPYGYAARTRTANLLGGIEVDLKKEQITLRFQSRSREGVGLSVGNAFSGSVDIAGPLRAPRIVPNTPGLLFRGWAAFMTGGLSVIGESMFNRALASSNPCDDIRKEIRKDLCKSTQPLNDSQIACPANPASVDKIETETEDATGDATPSIGSESQ